MDRLDAVLVIDDKVEVHQAVRLALAPHAARVDAVAAPEAIPDMLASSAYECVLLDMNFAAGERSGREGMAALEAIKASDPSLAVIFMTAYGAVSLAVDGLKRGANDFLLKPWRNEALVAAVRAAAARTRAERRDASLDSIEKDAIARALRRHGGNILQAAASLGLSRQTLYRRMEKHGLQG